MTRTNRARTSTNCLLTLIAGLLAIGVFGAREENLVSRASAQATQPDDGMLVSAAEQRKQIIAEIRGLNARMERLESMLNRGLSVRVTEMPPIVIPQEKK